MVAGLAFTVRDLLCSTVTALQLLLDSHCHRGRNYLPKSDTIPHFEKQVRMNRHASPPAGTKHSVTKELATQQSGWQITNHCCFLYPKPLICKVVNPFPLMSTFLWTKFSRWKLGILTWAKVHTVYRNLHGAKMVSSENSAALICIVVSLCCIQQIW